LTALKGSFGDEREVYWGEMGKGQDCKENEITGKQREGRITNESEWKVNRREENESDNSVRDGNERVGNMWEAN
jgi:hypothetical protein